MERTFVEFELKRSHNWMPWKDIPYGMWFAGNPMSPCPSPPYFSCSMGHGIYVKIDGLLWSPTGNRNYAAEKLGEDWVIENYRPLKKVRVVEVE